MDRLTLRSVLGAALVVCGLHLLLSTRALAADDPERPAATATATAAVSAPAQSTANDEELGPVAVPEPTAAAIQFHRTGNWLWIVEQVWVFLVQAMLLFTGFSAMLRNLAARIGRVWFFTVSGYAVLYVIVVFVMDLPLAYYAGFVRQHAYGLSNQSLERWLGNTLKALGVEMAGGFLFLWVPYLLLRKSPKRWWLYTALLSVPFSFFVMLIAPVLIDPLFNNFTAMKNKELEARILNLAERSGISGSRIHEINKSVDTKALNAYVKGFLDTKRIVLYDTLLEQLDEQEVLAVLGHEMGHYVLGHITRSILLSALVVLATLFAVDRLGRWLIRLYGPRFGFTALADVASVPLLVLTIQISSLALAPIALAYSRYQEHEADQFALELTRTNHAAATAFAKLQQENLGVPWHGPLEKLWRSTHPSIGERIEFCNQYHPWKEGRPLVFSDYFRP